MDMFLYWRTSQNFLSQGTQGDTFSPFCISSVSQVYLTTLFFLLKIRRYCYNIGEFSLNNLALHFPIPFFPTHTNTLL